MEEILYAILRQLLISNQMKLMELVKNDSIRGKLRKELKIWDNAIKIDLDTLMTKEEMGGSDNV